MDTVRIYINNIEDQFYIVLGYGLNITIYNIKINNTFFLQIKKQDILSHNLLVGALVGYSKWILLGYTLKIYFIKFFIKS